MRKGGKQRTREDEDDVKKYEGEKRKKDRIYRKKNKKKSECERNVVLRAPTTSE